MASKATTSPPCSAAKAAAFAGSAKGTASLPPMPPSAVLPMTKEAAFASVQLSAPGSAQLAAAPMSET